MSQPGPPESVAVMIVTSEGQAEQTPFSYFAEQSTVVVATDSGAALQLLRTAANQARIYQLLIIDGRAGVENFAGLASRVRKISGTETMKIIMLQDGLPTSTEREPDIDFIVLDPLPPQRVGQILRQAGVTVGLGVESRIPASSPGEVGAVLLVEDDVVNRRVAATMLEVLGLRVGTASDGAEAVAAVEVGGWDLILMDCLMPVMDGIAAAREIRSLPGNQRDVPILAMSANISEVDVAEITAAGMSGCLSKPFSVDQLAEVIGPWFTELKPRGGPAHQSESDSTVSTDDVINDEILGRLSERLPPDRMARLVGTFLEESPKLLDRMTAAIDREDFDDLRLASHSLKGSSSFLGATEVTELARQVEGKSQQPDTCMPVVQETVAAFLRAQRALQRRFPTALRAD